MLYAAGGVKRARLNQFRNPNLETSNNIKIQITKRPSNAVQVAHVARLDAWTLEFGISILGFGI
jgi:hypothetical protein